MKYDVVIIGAGPAGLFTAYELITKNKNLNILLLDEGKFASKRFCPMMKTKKCINCKPCNIMSGYGGAGTFSDGKLNFIPKLGKSDLFKYMDEESANNLIDDCEKIFTEFEMDSDVYPSNMEEALKIKSKVALTGARLLLIKQKHLGSDHLPTYIQNFTNFLKEKGVTLLESTQVLDIHTKSKNSHEIECLINGKKEIFTASKVVVAPGRTGAKWVQDLADKYKIPYTSQSIEIGVRVEVRK